MSQGTKARPYVSISGINLVSEARAVADIFSRLGYNKDSMPLPFIGYLVSSSMNKFYFHVPKNASPSEMAPMMRATDYKTLNIIHYNTGDKKTLSEQIKRLFESNMTYGIETSLFWSGLCEGIQLNIVWPDAEEVEKIRREFLGLKIILQAGTRMLRKRAHEFIEEIKKYEDNIDYILLDPSGGRKMEFSIDKVVRYYEAISRKAPHIAVGFAGGFDSWNIEARLKRIISRIGTKDFSIDVESGVRKGSARGVGPDVLSMAMVERYLSRALRGFS